MVATAPPPSFVPASIDVADFSQLEPLYQSLLGRPVSSGAELEQWLADFSELSAVVDEYGCRRYIDKSCHTDDASIEKAYLHFVENIEPRVKPLFFRLQKKLLETPALGELPGDKYALLARKWRADVEIFRDENVQLETQVTRQNNEYDKIFGAMMVSFRGEEYTLQQMARFSEEPDRATRQEAWEAAAQRRLADREKIDGIFDTLLPLRAQIASNAGMPDYRAHVWKSLKRFDYTPDDCLKFADAIASTCMPLVRELDAQRAAHLGIRRLRPWDLEVDPHRRPPLRPFQQDQVPLFILKTREIVQRLSPALGADFDQLSANHNLDLDSRKGKQPGGYQISLEQSRQPFIFMNATGRQLDVLTLLHEAGHAFHALSACRTQPLVFFRSAPIEFCEVASMSMEWLGAEHFDVFYDSADAARAKRGLIERSIDLLPWIATIDSFQHWIYTHPSHSRSERTGQWLRLLERFDHDIDWSGFETIRKSLWHRQLHLFHLPFYYIEYGIAQLGALQLWMKSKQDPRGALNHYRSALALGGTRPLPELFAAAGIVFDFSEKTLRPLMDALQEELASLPE